MAGVTPIMPSPQRTARSSIACCQRQGMSRAAAAASVAGVCLLARIRLLRAGFADQQWLSDVQAEATAVLRGYGTHQTDEDGDDDERATGAGG